MAVLRDLPCSGTAIAIAVLILTIIVTLTIKALTIMTITITAITITAVTIMAPPIFAHGTTAIPGSETAHFRRHDYEYDPGLALLWADYHRRSAVVVGIVTHNAGDRMQL